MSIVRETVTERAAAGSLVARVLVVVERSFAMRLALACAIIVAFVLIPRPTQPIVVLVLIAAVIHIFVRKSDAAVRAVLIDTLRSAFPVLGLSLLACIVAIPTAFHPLNHLSKIPLIVALQVAVLLMFAIGRLVGTVPLRILMWWVFAILAAATALLAQEQQFFWIREGILGVPLDPSKYAILNRAFLVASIGLAFFVTVGRDLRSNLFIVTGLGLLAAVWMVTHSESARLVILVSALFLALGARQVQAMATLVVIGAVAAMLLGPFVYDFLLQGWKAGPLAGHQIGTFLNRLETYADFSALIRDSSYLGRGIHASKLIAEDPSLFAMPNRPCGPGSGFCPWHPHNAGLEITTDLGFLGIAWFSLVLWQVRTFALALPDWQQRSVIAVLVGFLAVSFVADGFWQTWWWLTAGLIAMWMGILVANPDRLDQKSAARDL